MCNIWKETATQEIQLKELINCFRDPLITNNLESINLTGGEPLLRPDLIKIAEVALNECKKLSSITINTNGLLTEKLLFTVSELYRLQHEIKPYELLLFLSVDGMDEKHDQVRGTPGSFAKVTHTLRALKELQKEVPFAFSVNFTINTLNYNHMREVYKFVTDMGIPIDFTYNMSSSFYFQIEHATTEIDLESREYVCKEISDFLNEDHLTYSRSYYKNLIKMINGSRRKIGCIFTDKGFFLHPNGDVYRCWAYNQKIGNIHNNSFTEIWNSQSAIDSLNAVKEQCESCYNNCYAHFMRMDSIKSLLANSQEVNIL